MGAVEQYVVVDGVCDDIFHHSRHGLRLFIGTLSFFGEAVFSSGDDVASVYSCLRQLFHLD